MISIFDTNGILARFKEYKARSYRKEKVEHIKKSDSVLKEQGPRKSALT